MIIVYEKELFNFTVVVYFVAGSFKKTIS